MSLTRLLCSKCGFPLVHCECRPAGARCAVAAGSVAAAPAAEPTEEEIHMEQLQRDERENWVQVTREMARDAGDPSYEGAWVKW